MLFNGRSNTATSKIMTAWTWAVSPRSSRRTGSHQASSRSGRACPRDAAFFSSGPPCHCCPGPGSCGCPVAASVAILAAPAPVCAPWGCAWAGPRSPSASWQNHHIYGTLVVQLGVDTDKTWPKQKVIFIVITLEGALRRQRSGEKCRLRLTLFYSPDVACCFWWPVNTKLIKLHFPINLKSFHIMKHIPKTSVNVWPLG